MNDSWDLLSFGGRALRQGPRQLRLPMQIGGPIVVVLGMHRARTSLAPIF